MKRHRRKHDQDLHKLDNERFNFLFEEDLLDEYEVESIDQEQTQAFDFSRWRADLTERSTKRERMRARDMKRGVFRERTGPERARGFDDLDD